jgi:hypothetical protein
MDGREGAKTFRINLRARNSVQIVRLPSNKNLENTKPLFFRRLEGKKAVRFFLKCSKSCSNNVWIKCVDFDS